MLNSSGEDWVRVFSHNRGHLIFSIYAQEEGHIGECQAVFDEHGDVEMSLLIGRRDLWQRGYGVSAAIQLAGPHLLRLQRRTSMGERASGQHRRLALVHEAGFCARK